MTILQLELNLWQQLAEAQAAPQAVDWRQLAEAQAAPQAVDWRQLCLAFDEAIDRTPVGLRLAMAADAIAEMADVFAARADEFFNNWHRQRVAHEGPILDDDLFAEFVRQSFSLDLSDFVAVPERYVRSDPEKSHEDTESVVAEVTKETALLLAGAEDMVEIDVEQEIRHQGYDEDIAAWAKAIALWMHQRGCDRVGFAELLDGVGYPVVKGWLAVLLDEGFAMDRLEGSDFYRSAGIWVALKREEIAIAC